MAVKYIIVYGHLQKILWCLFILVISTWELTLSLTIFIMVSNDGLKIFKLLLWKQLEILVIVTWCHKFTHLDMIMSSIKCLRKWRNCDNEITLSLFVSQQKKNWWLLASTAYIYVFLKICEKWQWLDISFTFKIIAKKRKTFLSGNEWTQNVYK